MKKIELSISTAMSLSVLSSSGSDEPEENEEIQEEDVADIIMSTSDEDFEKLSPEDFEEAINGEENLGDDDKEEDNSEVNEEELTDAAADDGSEQTEDDSDSDGDQPEPKNEEAEAVDVKQMTEAYNLIFGKPIKASGREVQLRNPEHAKNFIEMGIDYNKKMQAMKPHMKTLKTLEKEGLLDDMDKLNLLLEVKHGNKDALKRLIAESDIDPLDFADEEVIAESRNYQAQNHMMSDSEVEIGAELDSISGTESGKRTLQIMTKEFDAKSREIISQNPSYIGMLNRDIQNGVYDEIAEVIQYKRDMKVVPANASDMEVYIQTVQELDAQAARDQAERPETPSPQPRKKGSSVDKKRRQGMSGSRSSNSNKKVEYDPLSMSDEDFMKLEDINIL